MDMADAMSGPPLPWPHALTAAEYTCGGRGNAPLFNKHVHLDLQLLSGGVAAAPGPQSAPSAQRQFMHVHSSLRPSHAHAHRATHPASHTSTQPQSPVPRVTTCRASPQPSRIALRYTRSARSQPPFLTAT